VNVVDASGWIEFAELAQAHRLPMADAIIYSVARVHEATLWTQDADLRGLDGVKYVDAHRSR